MKIKIFNNESWNLWAVEVVKRKYIDLYDKMYAFSIRDENHTFQMNWRHKVSPGKYFNM